MFQKRFFSKRKTEHPEPERKVPKEPHTESITDLTGWPGHRTTHGRSGLDPLDSDFELAHMTGVFLRNLFTLQLRSYEALYLILMALFGICGLVLFSLIFIIGMLFQDAPVLLWIFAGLIFLTSVALLTNFSLSLAYRRAKGK